jgi:hypothetical protein
MQLISPSGRRYAVGGFYFGGGRWKARFSPSELGRWSWSASLTGGRRGVASHGDFKVVPSKRAGFVRPSPRNRFRWIFANGAPYYPIGIGDCILDANHTGSALSSWGLDGGFRPPGVHLPGTFVDMATYLRAYAGAGVNLFRWSVDNCSFGLYQTIDPSGNVYLEREGRWGDQLVRALRKYGFRAYMVIFGPRPPFAGGASSAQLDAVKRYVKYVVDRYGAYVDFWELMNEANASDPWYAQIGGYLRQIDPYHHPISTSFERPDLSVIDINAPHWYETESEFDSDSDTWRRMTAWKQAGKPVIVGEQGNTGQNWDPTSALRMRLRAWAAFFAEGTLVFWNASFAKDYRNAGAANLYIGPEERGYLRILQRFTRGVDSRSAITTIGISDPARVRGYALRSPIGYEAYLHAYTNHSTPTTGVGVTINAARHGVAVWTSPATGAVIARQHVNAGTQTLSAPSFATDVALKIS